MTDINYYLEHLSPDDLALVKQYQRTSTIPTLEELFKIQGTIVHTTLNRRGRTIHNWARFILYVIKTIAYAEPNATCESHSFPVAEVPPEIPRIR